MDICTKVESREEQSPVSVLPEELMGAVELSGLTRRHAMALLRVPSLKLREAALVEMAYLRLPPEEADRYVDAILSSALPLPVRDFISALSRELEALRASGVMAELARDDADNLIKLTLRIPIT